MKKASKNTVGHIMARSTQKEVTRPNIWVGLVIAVIVAGFGLHNVVGSNADAKTARTGQAVAAQQVKPKSAVASIAIIAVPTVLVLAMISLLLLQLRRPKAKTNNLPATPQALPTVVAAIPTSPAPVVTKTVDAPVTPVQATKPVPVAAPVPKAEASKPTGGRATPYDPGSVITPGQK